jgi:hypothetical protein
MLRIVAALMLVCLSASAGQPDKLSGRDWRYIMEECNQHYDMSPVDPSTGERTYATEKGWEVCQSFAKVWIAHKKHIDLLVQKELGELATRPTE